MICSTSAGHWTPVLVSASATASIAARYSATNSSACAYTNRTRKLAAAAVVMVTSRRPADGLYHALADNPEKWQAAGITSVQAIGDCDAPATIALAIYDGHRAARELDAPPENPDLPFRREEISLDTAV